MLRPSPGLKWEHWLPTNNYFGLIQNQSNFAVDNQYQFIDQYTHSCILRKYIKLRLEYLAIFDFWWPHYCSSTTNQFVVHHENWVGEKFLNECVTRVQLEFSQSKLEGDQTRYYMYRTIVFKGAQSASHPFYIFAVIKFIVQRWFSNYSPLHYIIYTLHVGMEYFWAS